MRSLFFVFTVAVLAADPSEAACSRLFSEVGDRCLRFFPDAELRWTEAQSRCDVIGGHLAQVDTCEILGEISSFIASRGNTPTTGAYWIGATDVLNEGQFVWVNDLDQIVPRGVPFWGSDSFGAREPNGGANQNCVAISAADGYHFYDEECDNLYGVLCEEDIAQATTTSSSTTTFVPTTTTVVPSNNTTFEPSNTTFVPYTTVPPTVSSTVVADFNAWKVICPVGYTDIDGKCYLALSDAVETWDAARVTCNLNGGRLAKVDQCDQLRSLSQFLSGTNPNIGYWVGLSDEDFEGVFQYVDGTVVLLSSVFWGQTNGISEPNGGTQENCVALYGSDEYYFHDADCSYTIAVLCEAEGFYSTTTPSSELPLYA